MGTRYAQRNVDVIYMRTMLQLVAGVVADSLGNFLPELPTSATPPGQPQA